jgi:hypothetical protein
MNGQLGIYDLQGRLEKSYTGHLNNKYCIDVTYNKFRGRQILVGGSEDGSVCVWDLQSQYLVAKIPVVEGENARINMDYHEGLD